MCQGVTSLDISITVMHAYCSKQMEELNLQMFSWMDMDKFEMQLILHLEAKVY